MLGSCIEHWLATLLTDVGSNGELLTRVERIVESDLVSFYLSADRSAVNKVPVAEHFLSLTVTVSYLDGCFLDPLYLALMAMTCSNYNAPR